MNIINVDNYIINEPILNILYNLRSIMSSGKLSDIRVSPTDINVTCPNEGHSFGHEKNPDCHINTDTSNNIPYGTFHCFGCGQKGDFIKFVSLCFNSSRDYAKQWLIKTYGILSDEAIIIDDEIKLNNNKSNYLDESILDQYQKWTPYLGNRKLNRDICEKFNVRYDPYYRQVIFPIKDIHGNLKMLAKRSIDTKFFHMDKAAEKEVYGLNVIQKNNVKEAVITEGPIDCLSGWSFGFPTIATLGEVSDYQIDQINKSCLTILYTMFDNDNAGKKFTNMVIKKVSKRILVIPIQIPNGYKDLNDLNEELFKKLLIDAKNKNYFV